MNRWITPILILLVCFIPACLPTSERYTELESRLVNAAHMQSILVQVDYGEVTVLESKGDTVEVGGQVLFTDDLEYLVSSTDEQITVKIFVHRHGLSKVPLHVVIQLPRQIQVKIETDHAFVFIRGFQGDLEVISTSGDITLEQITGRMTLRSNRGNITVRESAGDVSIVGNYGTLTIQNVSGETAASTIMGNVVFEGLIHGGDAVRLETDHGSVSVNLSDDSALGIQVRSTSGDVACMLSDMTSTTRTCGGEIGSGEGNLFVRTVSGAVTLQLIP